MTPRLFLAVVIVSLASAPAAAQDAAPASASVSGRVTDADTGEPLVGANVLLRLPGTAPEDAPGAVGFAAGTATGNDGRFSLTGIEPGDYVLAARYVGYAEATAPVTLERGASRTVDLTLAPEAFLGDVVVSASRREEKVLDAPASISVLSAREVESTVAPVPVAALKNVAAVDETQTGVTGRELVIRGFTSAFSGSAFTLTDYRQAALPALGANAYALMPVAGVDLERIEVVRGPAATLYGPGVTSGVVHFISQDPFTTPGTTVALQGGERSLIGGEARHAGTLGERFGYKVVGTYAQGDDFELDRERPANAALLGQEVAPRDYGFWKYTAYGSAAWRPAAGTSLTVDAGLSGVKGQFLTDLGTVQAEGYRYYYGQARLQRGPLFAQAFVNAGDAGGSYLYGTPADPARCEAQQAAGEPCRGVNQVNKSRLYSVQGQYALDGVIPRSDVTLGVDVRLTRPESEGTVYGRFEGDDAIDEYGLYAQSSTALVRDRLDLVLALRGDYTNIYEEVAFSPRAGLVFKPSAEHTLRATYNRSAAAPGTNSLFLDLIALNAGGLNVRALGNAFGFAYGRNDAFRGLAGTDLVSTSLLPSSLGERRPAGAFLEEAYGLLYGQIAATDPAQIQAALAAQGLPVDLATTEALVGLLDPAFTEVDGFSPGAVGFLNLSDPSQIDFVDPNTISDLEALGTQIYNTFEVGYKGVLGGRLIVGLDAYYERSSNLVTPLALGSPFVVGATLEADLAAALAEGIAGNAQLAGALAQLGVPPEQAAELIVGFSQGAFAGPIGIIEPDVNRAAPGQTPELFLTFRNGGAAAYYGVDVSTEWVVSDRVNAFANASFIAPTFFDNEDLGSENESFVLSSNTTGFKVKGGASYFDPEGLSANASFRYADGYRVRSGPYIGFVESYAVVDVGAGYALGRVAPGLRLDVTVSNVLNSEHWEFVGAPDIGRLAIARLTFDF